MEETPDPLQQLLAQQPALQRGPGSGTCMPDRAGLPSGFDPLDATLPWRGWPERGLVEVIQPRSGMGEFQLLTPLLRHFTQQQRPVLLITPPHQLYTPALIQADIDPEQLLIIRPGDRCQQALWSTEKALQSHDCALVLVWQKWLSSRVIRRLQLAASQGGTPGFLFHHRPARHSPATLQVQMEQIRQHADGGRSLRLRILKTRGSYRPGTMEVTLDG